MSETGSIDQKLKLEAWTTWAQKCKEVFQLTQEQKVYLKPGISKVWPTSQNWTHCLFLNDLQVRMIFTFFKWLKKIRILCNMWKLYKIQISVSISNILLGKAEIIYVCIICGCFYTEKVDLSSCYGEYMAHKA